MPKSLTDKLEAYRLLIFNSSDQQVASQLETIGLDADYLASGQKLYEDTMKLVAQQKKEYQEQSLAYDQFYVAKDQAEADHNRTLKLVKVVSRSDEDLQNRLGLNETRPQAIGKWIEQAVDFYNALLNEAGFLTTLERFKVTQKRLNNEKEAIEHLRTLRNQAILEKGQAQEATRVRNEKLDELEDYCTELKALAQLALEQRPQLLEKLGILVR